MWERDSSVAGWIGMHVFNWENMSMSRLCRYACGLACLVTMIALVACGAGPGATKAQDPVGFKPIELKQGESIREISLVNTFSGSELTYKATSDKPSVVTVTVDNEKDTLTVRVVAPGPATKTTVKITVTATNSQGSAPQSFNVTVPPKPEPEDEGTGGEDDDEDEEGAPTVKADAPDNEVNVDQGDTHTVTLSRVFEGDDLEYDTPTSSAPAVATASESAGILTITAHSPGTATITIVATNGAGSVTHPIAVTVTAPVTTTPETPTTSSGTLTIKRGESAERKLDTGQTLKSPDEDAVAVEPSGTGAGNVWIITAIKKGTYTITIFNGDGTPESRGIVVVIPNSLPLRLHQVPNPVPVSVSDFSAGRFDTIELELTTYFEDPDEDMLEYKVENKLPSWILMDAKTGFATLDSAQLTFEVLEKQLDEDRKFTVTLYAVDDSGGTSQRPVVLELTAPDGEPATSMYKVRQAPNGDLNRDGTLRVGPRMVSGYHTLEFLKAADNHLGFRFASLKAESLVKAGDLYSAGNVENITTVVDNTYVDGDVIPKWVKADPDDANVGDDVNSDYYILKSSGDVEAQWNIAPALGGDPKIDFRLTGTGRGTITIEYHVWKYTGSGELTETTKGNAADKATGSISLDIVTCNSPPDPLSDCPGAPPPPQ